MTDRIADIWGTRTPYARDGRWPVRVDQALAHGLHRGRRRPLGAVRVRAVQQRLRVRHRRAGRRDGRRPRPRRRPGQPRPARAQGPVRQLAGRVASGPADPAADPRRRRLVETDWDTAMGRDRRAEPAAAGRDGPACARLLHQRPAVPGGVLHARRDRQGRNRHPAHGRQHPAVHGHRGRGAEGDLRRDGQPGVLRRRRHLRRDLPVRPQHGRDADGAVVADAGPHRRPGPAADRRASTRGDTEVAQARRTSHLAVAAGHQPGADERADPRTVRRTAGSTTTTSTRTRVGFDELRADGRARGRAEAVAEDLRGAGRGRRRAAEIFGTSERVLSTVLQGFYQSHQATAAVRARSTTCTCCAACSAGPAAGSCR